MKTKAGYARYWEDDFNATPVIVRTIHQEGEFVTIFHPDGYDKQVHIHTLGRSA